MRSYQVDMCNGPIFKKLIIFITINFVGLPAIVV